jgi:hypothetical protein
VIAIAMRKVMNAYNGYRHLFSSPLMRTIMIAMESFNNVVPQLHASARAVNIRALIDLCGVVRDKIGLPSP